eukprot:COSAG01_NODE_7184_length_3314_cov_31.236703_3_plen_52_part_00
MYMYVEHNILYNNIVLHHSAVEAGGSCPVPIMCGDCRLNSVGHGSEGEADI